MTSNTSIHHGKVQKSYTIMVNSKSIIKHVDSWQH